jgi:hypothetical protein
MSKAHRGKPLRETPNKSRGTCPSCNRSAIKLMYEVELAGVKTKVCKQCKAKVTAAV